VNEGAVCGVWPAVGHAGRDELVAGTGGTTGWAGWNCALRSVSRVVDERPGAGPKSSVGPVPEDFCRLNAVVRNCAIYNALTHTFFLLGAELEGTACADLAFFPVSLGMQ
jgi:hypothetical protein